MQEEITQPASAVPPVKPVLGDRVPAADSISEVLAAAVRVIHSKTIPNEHICSAARKDGECRRLIGRIRRYQTLKRDKTLAPEQEAIWHWRTTTLSEQRTSLMAQLRKVNFEMKAIDRKVNRHRSLIEERGTLQKEINLLWGRLTFQLRRVQQHLENRFIAEARVKLGPRYLKKPSRRTILNAPSKSAGETLI